MKVFSIFESISGEVSPFHQGRISTFVRFSGCCCSCNFCDQPEALSISSGTEKSGEEILQSLLEFGHQYIILTGGEPLIQPNLVGLIDLLTANGFLVSIETSGAVIPMIGLRYQNIHWVVDYKCPGSGESKNMKFPYISLTETDFIKFPIGSRDDFNFAERKIKDMKPKAQIAFSPIYRVLDPKELMEWIINAKLDAILNLQIHKFIGVE